ncbi:MAG: helix-turn-helix domain-containing protein [Defluviitaleaceae bacterium]|nr:helix-turn-helix domain-containing protein [Defluviitaleaceae bacterium]
MALLSMNLIIKEARKARGMTQGQLAEGICSRETVVKLEKGDRKPNWFVQRELLRRLNLYPSVYQDVATTDEDVALYKRLNNIYAIITKRKFDKAKIAIDGIDAENAEIWQGGLWHEMLLRLKVFFYTYETNPHINPRLAIELGLECLEFARPDFDLDDIDKYFLATHEFQTIYFIATAYLMLKEYETTINIHQSLKKSFESRHSVSFEPAGTLNREYRMVLASLGDALMKVGRAEECLQIVDEAIARHVFAHDDIFNYAQVLSTKSAALHALGRVEESREAAKKSLFIYYVISEKHPHPLIEEKVDYEKRTGEQLDLSIPW